MASLTRSTLLPALTFFPLVVAGWPTVPATGGPPPDTVAPTVEDVAFVGRVVSRGTGAPIPSVHVRLGETRYGARSSSDGGYAFRVPRTRLAEGEHRLIAEGTGYEAEEAVVRVPRDLRDDTLRHDFTLRREATLREEQIDGRRASGAGESARVLRPTRHPTVADASAWSSAPTRGRGAGHPDWNREQYAHIDENPWRAVRGDPLSTFSIDVDRASYSNVRRFLLREGRLPPTDAVQVEEMINYFSYDYTLPDGDHPLALTTELGDAPWREGHRLLRIGLASRPVKMRDAPPNNLVFLLDVSGSMKRPDKLPLVKRSMRLLVNELRPEDRVAIVVYAGAAGLVLESTSGAEKERILDAIARLEAGGSTAGGAGLRLAYRVAREHFLEEGNNRVVLATDGDFNVGESSDSEMIRLIEEKREEETFLTVLGFGTGNLQSEKMQSIAQHGNGNYAYIDSFKEARKVLVGEMGGTLLTVARDVKLQVEFNPARVRAYRLIGYENRLLDDEDFNDDAKDAGDLGAGHRVTALYEIIAPGVESEVTVRGTDRLRYREPGDVSPRTESDEVAFVRVRYKPPPGSESRLLERPVLDKRGTPSADLRFASAVAGFGMLLRDSEHRGEITASRVLALAQEGLGPDREGHRRGFLELVRAYQRICGCEGVAEEYEGGRP